MAEAQNITVKTGGCPWWVLLLVLIIGTALGFFIRGRYLGHDVLVQTDTLIVRETTKIEYPVEVKRFTDKSIMFIPLWINNAGEKPDTVTINDTVFISVPKEIKEYRDASYFARVSGYYPSLDYIEVYPETKVITNTETILPHKNYLSLGIDIGYLKNFTSPIYIEYERKLYNNFSLHGRVLYDLPGKSIGAEVGGKVGFGW